MTLTIQNGGLSFFDLMTLAIFIMLAPHATKREANSICMFAIVIQIIMCVWELVK